ncbi:TniQ family protein [Streptomyces sp. YS-B37]|uniref:TniQ family protein n=1 Tax=Streptomyces sp. YS-B37 TaxID=3407669 RepID=UPI003B50B6F9
MSDPRNRPLPRSLDPLQGESLAGYVLRLSHRLQLPPGWLIRHTGLADTNAHGLQASDLSLSLALPDEVAHRFARATRLSREEVTELTLTCWNGFYPPLSRAISARQARRQHSEPWLFPRAMRYCPTCLAGNGSPVEERHGGAWRKEWHLPVVYACVEHRIFLRDLCPGCRSPVNGIRHGRLVDRVGDQSLHPLQCRNSLRLHDRPNRSDQACGSRLDQPPYYGPGIPPSTDQLALQSFIQQHLAPRADPALATEYFTDLRLITALICVTWPMADYTVLPFAANTVDRHLRRQADQPTRRWFQRLTTLPSRADTTAALLQIAHTVLATEDLRAVLMPLILHDRTRTRHATWTEFFIRRQAGCSPRLADAVAPLTRAVHGRPAQNATPTHGWGGLEPRHVPAYLPQSWFDSYFAHSATKSGRLLRRNASVRLAQLTLGGSLDEAAAFLGIPTKPRAGSETAHVHRWAHTQVDPFDFDNALEALADSLTYDVSRLVDYQLRREALKDWRLDLPTWHELTARMPVTSTTPAKYDDLKRQVASIFVWSRITQGEHQFAPRPMEAEQGSRTQTWWGQRRNTMWCLLTNPGVSPHYTAPRNLLIEYADAFDVAYRIS